MQQETRLLHRLWIRLWYNTTTRLLTCLLPIWMPVAVVLLVYLGLPDKAAIYTSVGLWWALFLWAVCDNDFANLERIGRDTDGRLLKPSENIPPWARKGWTLADGPDEPSAVYRPAGKAQAEFMGLADQYQEGGHWIGDATVEYVDQDGPRPKLNAYQEANLSEFQTFIEDGLKPENLPSWLGPEHPDVSLLSPAKSSAENAKTVCEDSPTIAGNTPTTHRWRRERATYLYSLSQVATQNLHHLLGIPFEFQANILLEALLEVQGCFEAAYAEGLAERLLELPEGEPGSLRDLVERRLIPAQLAIGAAIEKVRT